MTQTEKSPKTNSVQADIIILGCSLPGIVTAHKLKKKFGNTMDIVVLDMAITPKGTSKCNVSFQEDEEEEEPTCQIYDLTARDLIDNVARQYLALYAKEFMIPLPDAIVAPENVKSPLYKLFDDGDTVRFTKDFYDIHYLGFLERFELNQYQTFLDQSMRDLFQANKVDSASEKQMLLYYDRTTMERHICYALIFTTSREIMRTTVRLVCGVAPDNVSVLFYLHQCYRTSSARNHLDRDNTRFREKLLGYCRKRLASKLQRSIASITLLAKPIKEIRTYSDEQVILETIKGETNYICTLLAMALRPDELNNIQVEDQLLSEKLRTVVKSMKPGKAKKFLIRYEENFWGRDGYSGDILSVRGPILWAMERPVLSTTGSTEQFPGLMGYLLINDDDLGDSKKAVIAQLVKLFGKEAAKPISYKETIVADVYVPRCGDFVALRKLTSKNSSKFLEWGALDVFADGDVAAALEAGHTAYLHLLSYLRPQAQTYEDVSIAEWPTILNDNPLKKWLAQFNIIQSARLAAYSAVLLVSFHFVRSYIRK